MILNGWPRRSFRALSLERRRRKQRRMVVSWWLEVLPKMLKLGRDEETIPGLFQRKWRFLYHPIFQEPPDEGVGSKRFNIIPSSPLSWRQTVAWHHCPIGIHNLVMKGMSWISRQANFRHWRAHEALTSFDAPSISTLVAFAGWHGVVMFAPLNILDARYCYQVFQYCNTAGRLKAFKSPTMDFALKTPTFFSDSDHFCRCQRWRAKRSLRGHFALYTKYFLQASYFMYTYIQFF